MQKLHICAKIAQKTMGLGTFVGQRLLRRAFRSRLRRGARAFLGARTLRRAIRGRTFTRFGRNKTPWRRKSAVSMYWTRRRKVKNYRLRKRSVRMPIVRQVSNHTFVAVSSSAALTSMNLVPMVNLFAQSDEPVKNQSTGNENVRTGDRYNIVFQQLRMCINAGSEQDLSAKGFCVRMIIYEFDYKDYSAWQTIDTTDLSFKHLYSTDLATIGTTSPLITNFVRNTAVNPVSIKFKIISDRSFIIGAESASNEHKDLKVHLPRRVIRHDRNADTATSVPIGGKFYAWHLVHDGTTLDVPPSVDISCKTVITD